MVTAGNRPDLDEDEAHLMYGYVASVPELLTALRKAGFVDTCWMVLKKALGNKFPEEILLIIHGELGLMDHELEDGDLFTFVGILMKSVPSRIRTFPSTSVFKAQ